MGKLGSKMREEARFRTGWLRVLVLVSVLALLVMSLLGLVLGASGVGAQDVLALLSGGKVAGSARFASRGCSVDCSQERPLRPRVL